MKNISNYINEQLNESATPKQVKFGKIIEYSIGGTKISASNFDSEYESISDGNDVDEHFKNKEDEIAFIKQHKNDIIENGVSNSDRGFPGGDNGEWFNEFTIDGVKFNVGTDKAFFKKEYPYEQHVRPEDITYFTIDDVLAKVVGYDVNSREFKDKLKTMDYKSWINLDNYGDGRYKNLSFRPFITFLRRQMCVSYDKIENCKSKLDKTDGMYINTCEVLNKRNGDVTLNIKTKKPLFKNNKLIL